MFTKVACAVEGRKQQNFTRGRQQARHRRCKDALDGSPKRQHDWQGRLRLALRDRYGDLLNEGARRTTRYDPGLVLVVRENGARGSNQFGTR
jgi:hypothetical protein